MAKKTSAPKRKATPKQGATPKGPAKSKQETDAAGLNKFTKQRRQLERRDTDDRVG